MPEFIFMLTREDRTVADALAVYEQVRDTAIRWVGFKDVGLPTAELDELSRRIRADGRTAVLEVVSTDADAEARSIRAGVSMGVDVIMGGTRVDAACEILRGSDTRYFPFPGRVIGHPSRLEGSIAEIAVMSKQIAARPGVHGLDLLAYRHAGDVPALIRSVVDAVDLPVVVAGSVDTLERVRTVGELGAWGFTIGSAIFEARFGAGSIRHQVETVLLSLRGSAAA